MNRNRITTSNPVRRRLFFGDPVTEVGRTDNFVNILNEELARDKEEKMLRWNFDFDKEIPLDGDYEWEKCDGTNEYIGRLTKKRNSVEMERETAPILTGTEDINSNQDFESSQFINETTPDKLKIKESSDNAPLLPKRRKKSPEFCSETSSGVKRSINFD